MYYNILMQNKLDKLIKFCSNSEFWNMKNETFYFGIDPTGDGIHLGHMIGIKLALVLLEMGHNGIILTGGFTGSIGDPSGKATERSNIDKHIILENTSGILNDIEHIFTNKVLYVNNYDWLSTLTLSDILGFLSIC